MRRLIINADDLGVNPQRSHGIFQCAEFGVVTSVSIIPNGSDSDAAAKHARERGVSAGLHLNLTEEYPLSASQDVASIADTNGRFLGVSRLKAAIEEGKVRREHLEREVRAQVEWIFDSYGAPSHINGHHRMHQHPMVIDVLLPLMERYGIRFTRITIEEPLPPHGYVITDGELAAAKKVNDEARIARDMYASHGILSTDHFRGLTLHGNASLKNLRHIIAKLPEGTTELMVHPGSAITYGTPFDLDPQRRTELHMLLDESIPALLRERKIELIGWDDM